MISMDMILAMLLFIIVILLCRSSSMSTTSSLVDGSGYNVSALYNVMDYGAKGDGIADDKQAFMKAWDKVCNGQDNSPTLVIPGSRTFRLSATSFDGPCKPSYVTIEIFGDIVLYTEKEAWSHCEPLLNFHTINNLYVIGKGGQGQKWWSGTLICSQGPKKPTNVAFSNCTSLQVSDLVSKDSGKNHVSITGCRGAMFSNIRLTAPGNSPNTDGIDISNSNDINIQGGFIGTGDDCIAINTKSHNINITNVECGPGHGISIGSLGREGESADVDEVHVRGCTFKNTQNGARIKTFKGGKGKTLSITFEQITLENVENPIITNQHYPEKNPPGESYSSVDITGVKYRDFVGTSKGEYAVRFDCASQPGCSGIDMWNVTIKPAGNENETGNGKVACLNAHGKAENTDPPVTCLDGALYNL